MANASRGELDIILGGTTYTLRPSFEAIEEFEQMTGLTAMRAIVMCNDPQTCTVKLVATALLCGIRGACESAADKMKLPSYNEIGERMMRGDGGYSEHVIDVVHFLGNALMDDKSLQEKASASVKNLEGSTD